MAPHLPFLNQMDIARPEFKVQRRRRQAIIVAAVVVAVAAVSVGVARLKPAAPAVERGTVWTDTVKRGSMLRQVRGIGIAGAEPGSRTPDSSRDRSHGGSHSYAAGLTGEGRHGPVGDEQSADGAGGS